MKWLAPSLVLILISSSTLTKAQAPQDTTKSPPKSPEKVKKDTREVPKDAKSGHLVDGLILPAPQEVDAKEKYVVVQAKTSPDYKLQSVDWIIVSMSQEPVKYTELDGAVIVAVPEKGEAVLIYADALLLKEVEAQVDVEVDINGTPTKKKANLVQKEYKKTKWATTSITVKGSTPPKTDGGATPGTPGTAGTPLGQPVAIPATAGKLHIVVVLDNISGDVRQKTLYEANTWRETLKKGAHLTYVYDSVKDDRLLQAKGLKKLMTDAGGGSVIIVMTPDGRPIPTGTAIKLPITDDPARNELIVLDLAGRAAGGK